MSEEEVLDLLDDPSRDWDDASEEEIDRMRVALAIATARFQHAVRLVREFVTRRDDDIEAVPFGASGEEMHAVVFSGCWHMGGRACSGSDASPGPPNVGVALVTVREVGGANPVISFDFRSNFFRGTRGNNLVEFDIEDDGSPLAIVNENTGAGTFRHGDRRWDPLRRRRPGQFPAHR